MAYEYIKHKCGHEKKYQLLGVAANRDKERRRLQFEYCRECQTEKNEDAARDMIESYHMPEITFGSEKQLAYANDLRNRYIVDTEDNIDSWDRAKRIAERDGNAEDAEADGCLTKYLILTTEKAKDIIELLVKKKPKGIRY